MKFLHSVCVQEQAISSDGLYTYDLPVNPLSVLLVNLRPLNETSTLANFQQYMGICQALNRISVWSRGVGVVSMKGEDAAAMAYFRYGCIPFQGYNDNVDNDRRCVSLPIIFGRGAYDPDSCLPSHKRGELAVEIDIDVADTGYDGMRISMETVELLDAKPKEFERKVSVSTTPAATGDTLIDFSPGNKCRGLLCFGTTPFSGASPAPSLGRVKVLVDNEETHFHATDFEVSQALTMLWGRQPPNLTHKHTLNAAGAGIEETTSTFEQGVDMRQFSFLDFDPTKDDTYTLDASKASRFCLSANIETADAVRITPVEVIKV